MSDNRRAFFLGEAAATTEPVPIPANTNEDTYEEHHDNDHGYRAFREARGAASSRLRLRFAKRHTKTFSYYHLVTADCLTDELLALHFDTHVVTLEGTHLDIVDDHLAEERIRELVEFHQGKYEMPPEGEPVITNIIVQTLEEVARTK